jgi:hypothetical protein
MSRIDDELRQWHCDNDARQSRLDADERRRQSQREAHKAIRTGRTSRALSAIGGADMALDYLRRTQAKQPQASTFPMGLSAQSTDDREAGDAQVAACIERLRVDIACSRYLSRESRDSWQGKIEGFFTAPVGDTTRLLQLDAWANQLLRMIYETNAQPLAAWNVSVQHALGTQQEYEALLTGLFSLRSAVLARMARE